MKGGMDIFWASAFLRLQLLPLVRLTAGSSCTITILRRSIGTLTGSRSAVAAGRIPVESTACDLAAAWDVHGVLTDFGTIRFASWVDNYYTFGKSLHHAIHIAESFEEALSKRWQLTIKGSSRSVLSPEEPGDDWNRDKWPLLSQVDILGHLVTADCS